MKRDFSELYSELGLPAGCTLAELKLAYRRRLAKLHPDHGNPMQDAGVPLPDLAGLYDSATRFHRRHGRLPGAKVSTRLGGGIAPPGAASAKPAITPPATPGAGVRLSVASLLLPLVAVLVLVLLSRDWLSPAGRTTSEQETVQPPRLQAGMDEATVIAIQGRPRQVRDGRWHYGSSWLKFEGGRLVDWRSSQDYPLETEAEAPTSPAQADSPQ